MYTCFPCHCPEQCGYQLYAGLQEITSIAFSSDSKVLAAQGGAPEWNLVVWSWEKSKLLASIKTSNATGSPVNQVCPHELWMRAIAFGIDPFVLLVVMCCVDSIQPGEFSGHQHHNQCCGPRHIQDISLPGECIEAPSHLNGETGNPKLHQPCLACRGCGQHNLNV